MPTRDILVIGGSTGALTALRKILSGLPSGFPAAVFVAIHTSPTSAGVLPQLLGNVGPLPAEYATDGVPLRVGRIVVARPDHHLLIKRGHVRVTRGPRENRFRPAVDPLFRTAATAYGPRVIGVILSGGQDDGVLGLAYIKRRGGIAIAQDPSEADAPSMPESAIRQVALDYVLRSDDIAAVIARLVGTPVDGGSVPESDAPVRDVAEAGTNALASGLLPGPPSQFTCPECGGALWELHDGELLRYQCHVGHGYNAESLVAGQAEALEGALWTALRALEEHAALHRRMARRARERGMSVIAASYEGHAHESEVRAQIVRRALAIDPLGDQIPEPSSKGPR